MSKGDAAFWILAATLFVKAAIMALDQWLK